ncbi:MAG: hypothetical protein PUK40_02735 [Actinomycetaceae bacterium]|nr:hypothetical protein [Arcanobacterium sp.]MDD7504857.1 hypothetical protein [Actinomycetaceae bacterium]MDY6142997.1 hypothetical protein [Arcanobacterium sp.]
MKDLPPIGYYVALVGWLAAVIAIGYVWNVRVASAALAASLVILACIRAVDTRGIVPHVRRTPIDVATLLILAGILGFFSIWGNSPAVS